MWKKSISLFTIYKFLLQPCAKFMFYILLKLSIVTSAEITLKLKCLRRIIIFPESLGIQRSIQMQRLLFHDSGCYEY